MQTNTAKSGTAVLIRPAEPDRAALQRIVDRRTALRFGLTLPVAAVVAQLAGIGPREGRR